MALDARVCCFVPEFEERLTTVREKIVFVGVERSCVYAARSDLLGSSARTDRNATFVCFLGCSPLVTLTVTGKLAKPKAALQPMHERILSNYIRRGPGAPELRRGGATTTHPALLRPRCLCWSLNHMQNPATGPSTVCGDVLRPQIRGRFRQGGMSKLFGRQDGPPAFSKCMAVRSLATSIAERFSPCEHAPRGPTFFASSASWLGAC